MNIPIEGAGCIEHFSKNDVLDFINAKVAVDIKDSPKPSITDRKSIDLLISTLEKENKDIRFPWDDPKWEEQIQLDLNDPNATWFPTAELIWAIDNYNDVGFIIEGIRYKLCYKIPITFISPEFESFDYYIDAQTGNVLYQRPRQISIYADIYAYGTQWLDAMWHGGFIYKYELNTDNNGHHLETKAFQGYNIPWNNISPIRKNGGGNWGTDYQKETSAHFHISNSWDFFRDQYGRHGIDNNNTKVRVMTQLPEVNAFYFYPPEYPYYFMFGYSPANYSLSFEPSIVGHEFTHGLTKFTAGLPYQDQSGALNESFSDIFGTVIQALTLEQTYTDWIIGNKIPNNPATFERSLKTPHSYGIHWNGQYVQSNGELYIETEKGQPRYYQDQYWYSCPSCPSDKYHDYGGVHINSGVQNHWFQILTDGNSSVQGIGMKKAAKITYKALTDYLMSSSQYTDSKEATIKAAIDLYGECSIEHKSTVKAWNAVGIYAMDNCTTTSINNLDNLEINIYPNPASTEIRIELPYELQQPIEIFDAQGRLVKKHNDQGVLLTINLSEFDNGVYFIKFDYNTSIITKKIIIKK